jgi:hypothetical protein
VLPGLKSTNRELSSAPKHNGEVSESSHDESEQILPGAVGFGTSSHKVHPGKKMFDEWADMIVLSILRTRTIK